MERRCTADPPPRSALEGLKIKINSVEMRKPEMTAPSSLTSAAATVDYAVRGLDDKQLAHLRHIENLANQPDGDWSHMGNADAGQEWVDSYRYQLAMAAYALGLAHYHRLPAAPCVFKPVYEALMRKMLRREVWGYWKDTSQSGMFVNPELTELRKPWIDPVVKENIMYSGHLHAMAGMYAVLFNDDRYAEPGSLTFNHAPIFWGLGPEKFEYDFKKLNEVIYWQMVESGWLGVACEPNCVFLVCNQYPILGFRFHDLRHQTKIADEATQSYRLAWEEKGMLDKDGHFYMFLLLQQDHFVDQASSGSDSWTAAAMNAWNPAFVRDLYPGHAAAWFKRGSDGLVSVNPPSVKAAFLEAKKSGVKQSLTEDRTYQWSSPDFGYAAIWASELGDADVLEGMLNHADRYMQPTYEKGGLYYPRNDASWDECGNMIYMDPLSGNSLLGYARLNVPNGLMHFYNQSGRGTVPSKPALIDMVPRIDVVRAYHEGTQLILTLRGRRDGPVETTLSISNVGAGMNWRLERDGMVVGSSDKLPSRDDVRVEQRENTLAVRASIDSPSEFRLTWE